MSSREYIKVYDKMSDEQKAAVADLWDSGVNHDGHVWVTYSDVEKLIVSLLKEKTE